MRRTTTLVLGLLALLATGCELPQIYLPPESGGGTGNLALEFVSLYGDSLAHSAQDDYEYLNRRPVNYFAEPMYTIDSWASDINRTPPNNVVVLALGTNDAHRSPPPFETWIQMLDRLRGNCVVWVKPYEIVDVSGSPVPAFNEQLEAILRSYPNVLIYDWNRRVLPEYLTSDHVHYNQLGQTAYAVALFEARDLC